MTMTLRRCDSLPTRLREAPVSPYSEPTNPLPKYIRDSTRLDTVPNFSNSSDRNEVIAAWKSLHTDIEKIKNGLPSQYQCSIQKIKKNDSIVQHNVVSIANNDGDFQSKVVCENRSAVRSHECNPCSSITMHVGQANTMERGASSARRRTLLERLLSWRTPECNCREDCTPNVRSVPKIRAEDLMCTCGVSRVNHADKQSKYSERGRSKSVGYEAAREVTQFRRCASAGATVGAETAAALRARAALTLARRYYPEGGWGWTITVVGTIVQILSHGLQLGGGTGAIACTAAVKYRVPPLYSYESSIVRVDECTSLGNVLWDVPWPYCEPICAGWLPEIGCVKLKNVSR